MTRTLQFSAGLGLGLFCAAAAHADANPYYLGGSLGFNRVSNVYRQTSGGNSDDVTTASLLAGLDQQIGRQHLAADASLQFNRYRNNTQLDNHGYSLHGTFDWSTIERISGTLSASANQQLASYNIAGIGVQQDFARNIERDQTVQSVVRVGLVTRWSLEGILAHNSQDFSLAAYNSLVFDQNSGSLGLVYKPHDLLRLGAALRHTDGEYPRYPTTLQPAQGVLPVLIYERDNFKRDDIDLTANWTPTGASSFDARISRTDATHDVATLLNFKGITGALGWNWQPSGKLSLGAHIARDTGTQLTNLGSNQNRVGYALDANFKYQLSNKVALTGSTSTHRSNYAVADNSGAHSSDSDRSYTLGASWTYSRSLSFTCQANWSGRDSTVAGYTYTSTAYGCTAQGLVY